MLSTSTIAQSRAERLEPLRNRDKSKLLVHEIYASVQGESSHMGKPCIFVRTTGCHLRCSYCDTEHAFFAGTEMGLDQIVEKVLSFGIDLVEITGGEPLLQPSVLDLFDRLLKENLTVLVETSGGVSISRVNRQVKVILDVKTPSSLEHKSNVFSNLDILWEGCEVKFVISTHEDYCYAKQICEQYKLYQRTHVLFSPVVARLDPKLLVDWIMNDRLPVRFQLQLHRVLYGETPGR